MKTKLTQLMFQVNQITRQKSQFIIALVAIVLLVLGAGAPDNGGLVGH